MTITTALAIAIPLGFFAGAVIGFARGKHYTLNVIQALADQRALQLSKIHRNPQPVPHSELRQ